MIKRVKALKKLQFENIKHEVTSEKIVFTISQLQYQVRYYEECHKLDLKYEALYAENNRQRQKIVEGEYEPTGTELEWKDEVLQEVIDKLEKEGGGDQRKVKGIPDFWLTVFQNANEPLLCGTFEAIDEPIMKFLQDVTITLPPENTSFTITFHFAPNQFFTNKELTKEYLMKNTFDPEDPLDFDGPEIYKSKGCKIDWKAGKNTTVKVKF